MREGDERVSVPMTATTGVATRLPNYFIPVLQTGPARLLPIGLSPNDDGASARKDNLYVR
jgi:hypothetical protein